MPSLSNCSNSFLAAANVKKMKNARLHSRRQPQTQRACLQRPPPRLAAVKNPSWSPATPVLMWEAQAGQK
jgi:hypothetical protein